MPIYGQAGHSIDATGATTYSKNPDTLYQSASTIKLLTALTARDWLTNLAEPVTIQAGDIPATGELVAGDTLTVSDIIHACLIRSNNAAAQALARVGGEAMIAEGVGAGTALDRFYQAMRDKGASFGWSGLVVANAWGGGSTNRMSARMLTDLMRRVHLTDSWLFAVAGKQDHDLTVTGGRTLTIPIEHTVPAEEVPGFLAGKSGTNGTLPTSAAFAIVAWTGTTGNHYTAVMQSNPANRYPDVRLIQDIVDTPITAPDRRRGASVVGLI